MGDAADDAYRCAEQELEKEGRVTGDLVVQEQLLDPLIGEIHPATPDAAGRLLTRLRGFYGPLRAAISDCERVLVEHSSKFGTKTFRVGDATYEVYGGNETVWDIAYLQEALEDAGCPSERIDQLIRQEITFKVNATVAKQLATNNKGYGDIIEAAKTVVEKPPRVRVKL